MATTQYIGARYVPLFYTNPDDSSNAWKSGVAYDPLTIVTDLNQSYTSKIPVPATVGRPSENPAYWVLTGAYNAQVDSYRQEVAALDTQVTELDGQIETIDGRITALGNTVESELDAVNEKIVKIANNGITGRRFIFVCDSYGNTGNPTFLTTMQNRLGISNDDIYSIAIGGSAFGSETPAQRFSNMLDSITVTDPETITDIFVVCGANEIGYTASGIVTGIQDVIAVKNTKYPNAIISIFPVGTVWKTEQLGLRRYSWLTALQAAPMYGVKVFYKAVTLLTPTELGTDRVHPTQTGVNMIAGALINAILGNEIVRSAYNYAPTVNTITVNGISNTISQIANYFMELYKDGVVTEKSFRSYAFTFSFDTAVALSNTNYIDINLANLFGSSNHYVALGDSMSSNGVSIIDTSNGTIYSSYARFLSDADGFHIRVWPDQPITSIRYVGIKIDTVNLIA